MTTAPQSSADHARTYLEQWLPDEDQRRTLLTALARSCAEAHHQMPHSWGVTLSSQKKSVRLNVGTINMLVISGDGPHSIMIDQPDAPFEPLTGVPRVQELNVSSAEFAATYDAVFSAHRAAMAQAGSRKGGYLWQGHSPGLLVYLRSWLGVAVPDPDNPKAVMSTSGVHSDAEAADEELLAFEGEARAQFLLHRSREWQLRTAKIREAVRLGKRSLACEVPGCGFDFQFVYGAPGAGYAQVHHLQPLKSLTPTGNISLDDLVIVCANCHAMIHRDGESRSLDELIQNEPATQG